MIIFPVYFIVLAFIVRFYWRRAKSRNPESRFRYSIIEIWCAIIGLTPTFVFISYISRMERGGLEAWPLVLAMFLSQVAGMVIMKVDVHEQNNNYEPAHAVLAGAFIGLLIPFILGLMAFPFLIILGSLASIGGPAIVFFGVGGLLLLLALLQRDRTER